MLNKPLHYSLTAVLWQLCLCLWFLKITAPARGSDCNCPSPSGTGAFTEIPLHSSLCPLWASVACSLWLPPPTYTSSSSAVPSQPPGGEVDSDHGDEVCTCTLSEHILMKVGRNQPPSHIPALHPSHISQKDSNYHYSSTRRPWVPRVLLLPRVVLGGNWNIPSLFYIHLFYTQ